MDTGIKMRGKGELKGKKEKKTDIRLLSKR